MIRPSSSLYIAAAIFVSGIVYAGEEISGDVAAASSKLARTQLPLREQSSFERDLGLLAEVLAAKVQYPAPENYTHDRVLGHELVGAIGLMSHWTNPQFIQPLVEHFKTSEIAVIECARALAAYRDDGLRTVVMSRQNYSRKVRGTSNFDTNPTYETVADVLQVKVPAEGNFEPLDTLLPDWKKSPDGFCWAEGLTVQTAVSQLNAESQSVRLQSWLWLADQGIVAPTAIALDCWPKLTESQQVFIARLNPGFVGSQRLLRLYEDLVERSSPELRRHLLFSRLNLGSDSAKTEFQRLLQEARQIVQASLESEDLIRLLSEAPGKSAFRIVRRHGSPEDIPMLIRIRRCNDQWIANSAILGLCRLDHPDAIEEVGKALADPARDCRDTGLSQWLQDQSVRDLKYRGLYLKVLADALRKRSAGKPEQHDRDLIDAFECMSGKDFASNVSEKTEKTVQRATFWVGWNSKKGATAGMNVVKGHPDPVRLAADKCLRWYSEQVPHFEE
jgi:hypothetical protein